MTGQSKQAAQGLMPYVDALCKFYHCDMKTEENINRLHDHYRAQRIKKMMEGIVKGSVTCGQPIMLRWLEEVRFQMDPGFFRRPCPVMIGGAEQPHTIGEVYTTLALGLLEWGLCVEGEDLMD